MLTLLLLLPLSLPPFLPSSLTLQALSSLSLSLSHSFSFSDSLSVEEKHVGKDIQSRRGKKNMEDDILTSLYSIPDHVPTACAA